MSKSYRPPGHFRSAEDFRDALRTHTTAHDCALETHGKQGPLGRDIEVVGKRLTNRWCIQPMEGWDGTPEGGPSELTHRRWRRFGRSGADLIWGGEAFAVTPNARANAHQLCRGPNSREHLGSLLESVHAGRLETGEPIDHLAVGLQLTHSGRFALPASGRVRRAQRNPFLDSRLQAPEQELVTDDELEGIAEAYVRSAELARAAGFDFVDVKCCHGYLLHELLGAHTRPGPYGGTFEGRTRLLRGIVREVRALGIVVACRVSLFDIGPFRANPSTGIGELHPDALATPYELSFGVDPHDPERFAHDDPEQLLALLEELGVKLLNVTLGSPYTAPHLQRPAAYPPSDGYEPPEDPLASVVRHLDAARWARQASDLVVVGSGYSYLQEWLGHVAEWQVDAGHVDFVGLGRMSLSYPTLPQDHLAGATIERRKLCRTFSDCTTAPRNGLRSGCYPLDPRYRDSDDFQTLKRLKRQSST